MTEENLPNVEQNIFAKHHQIELSQNLKLWQKWRNLGDPQQKYLAKLFFQVFENFLQNYQFN